MHIRPWVTVVAAFFGVASSIVAAGSFRSRVLDITVEHIKEHGPDQDVVRQVSSMGAWAWTARDRLAKATEPWLDAGRGEQVAAALEILRRLRGYRPMSGRPTNEQWNEKHAVFFRTLDGMVFRRLDRFFALKNDHVLRRLALYVGIAQTKAAKAVLLKIARETSAAEQALICLAWPRHPEHMDDLLPFMLADIPAARHLPYHFRASYGEAAIPYLRKAMAEAKSPTTRLEAAFELTNLRAPDGFDYLRDHRADGQKTSDRIRQFAIDHLYFPKAERSEGALRAWLEQQKRLLAPKAP